MIPRTLPAVDGSERTLSCVDETPSTGATVGWGYVGRGVPLGRGAGVGDGVAVALTGVAVVTVVSLERTSQPVRIDMMIRMAKGKLCFGIEITSNLFYRAVIE